MGDLFKLPTPPPTPAAPPAPVVPAFAAGDPTARRSRDKLRIDLAAGNTSVDGRSGLNI